jgi:hypothetical protein
VESPITKTFQQLYCEQEDCGPEKFEEKIFWRCLYCHAVPFAALLRWFDRDFFKRDFEYLHLIGLTTDANEFRREVESFQFSGQLDDGAFRRLLRLRVSAARLMKLRTILRD